MAWTEKYVSVAGGGAHDGTTAADAWTATAFRRIGQTWADVDAGRAPLLPAALGVESGPEGPGAHKMRAYAALAARR